MIEKDIHQINDHYDKKPSVPERILVSRSMSEIKWQEVLKQVAPKNPLSDALGECLLIDREVRYGKS